MNGRPSASRLSYDRRIGSLAAFDDAGDARSAAMPRASAPAAPAPRVGVPRDESAQLDLVAGGFSVTTPTASVINNASETLTFSSLLAPLSRRYTGRWAIAHATGVINGTGSGPFQLTAWSAPGGQDLGHNLVVGRGIIVPVNAPLPYPWNGDLTVVATNRSGASAVLWLTLWIQPWKR